jgi:hypothetical protein
MELGVRVNADIHYTGIRSREPVQGGSKGKPSRTIGAVQIGKIKNISSAALCVAVGAAADSSLTLLYGREAKDQSNESSESDDGLHE